MIVVQIRGVEKSFPDLVDHIRLSIPKIMNQRAFATLGEIRWESVPSEVEDYTHDPARQEPYFIVHFPRALIDEGRLGVLEMFAEAITESWRLPTILQEYYRVFRPSLRDDP